MITSIGIFLKLASMKRFLCGGIMLLLLLSMTAHRHTEQASTLKVKVKGLRSDKGYILIGLYKDQSTFKKREPYLSKKYSKKTLRNGELFFNLTLPSGTYGVTLLDDENSNGKCDYGFLLPKEGFGFSNYYHRGLSSPRFEDFDFNLTKDEQTIVVKVKYM